MPDVDVVVIGSGHNGLICAAYLAKSGLRVAVLERRLTIGGGLCTEEITIPGFYHNLHSAFHRYVLVFPWWRDLELDRFGVHYILPEVQSIAPLSDGRCLVIHRDPERAARSIARFSERDAKTYRDLYPRFDAMGKRFVAAEMFSPPLPRAEKEALLESTPEGREFLRFLRQSCWEVVHDLFETPALRALILYYAAVKGYLIRDRGVGHQVPASIVGGTQGAMCKGGSHRLAQGLAKCVVAHGGTIHEKSPVVRILLEGGAACGVELEDGTSIRATKAVVSNLNPHLTFLDLCGADGIPAELKVKTAEFQYGRWALFSAHMALHDPPRYAAATFEPDIDRGFNLCIGYETPEDLDAHFREIEAGLPPRVPGMQCGAFTVHDPTQAPPGKHTAFTWQFAPFNLRDGGPEGWDRIKAAYMETCIARWRHYAPNLDDRNILARFAYTPLDIRRKMVSMERGDFNHGRMSADQLFDRRPFEGVTSYRTPIPGLYLCGSSTHPGGVITGAPGHNAAGVIVDDLNIRKWWTPPDPRRLWVP